MGLFSSGCVAVGAAAAIIFILSFLSLFFSPSHSIFHTNENSMTTNKEANSNIIAATSAKDSQSQAICPAECCMCGDYGVSNELFRCKVCQFRSQHRLINFSFITCYQSISSVKVFVSACVCVCV